MRKQLLHHQPLLSRVLSLYQQMHRGAGRRQMHQANSLGYAGQLVVRQQCRGQPVLDGVAIQIAQGLLTQPPDPGLLNALGQRIHRRERRLFGRRHGRRIGLVFRMVEFVAGPAWAHLAETAHSCAFSKLVFLGGIEVKKPHHQKPGVIPQRHLQAAPTPHHQVGLHDLTFHNGNIADTQAAHGHYAGAVFITVGKMEQEILNGVDAQPGKYFRQGASYALELGYRDVLQ